jgi:hypothetical protein
MVDTRRSSDGIRLHPLLGGILADGARRLREKHPGSKITNAWFSSAAIKQLSTLGLIYKVEASKSLPENLPPSLVVLAKRGSGMPIWLPTDELAEKWIDIWDDLSPSLDDDEVCWPTKSTMSAIEKDTTSDK